MVKNLAHEFGALTMRFFIDFQKGCAWGLRMTTASPIFWGLISTWHTKLADERMVGRSVQV